MRKIKNKKRIKPVVFEHIRFKNNPKELALFCFYIASLYILLFAISFALSFIYEKPFLEGESEIVLILNKCLAFVCVISSSIVAYNIIKIVLHRYPVKVKVLKRVRITIKLKSGKLKQIVLYRSYYYYDNNIYVTDANYKKDILSLY